MFSTEDLDRIKDKIHQFNMGKTKNNISNEKEKFNSNGNQRKNGPNLNPSEILVIAGLLCGVLEVNSISIGRDQVVEVSLAGSLHRQTQLEQIMEQIGKCSFEEVIQAMLNGLG